MKILVSPRIEYFESINEERISLDIRWYKFLEFCGYEIEIFDYTNKNLDAFNGVILTGGNDLSSINPSKQNIKRDNFERRLVKFAINKNIPLLGICRGAQLLAHIYNSKLVSVKNHVQVKHKLINKNRSNLLGFKLEQDRVNSYHNYGIVNLGGSLEPLAFCEDETIEAFEHIHHKILGLIWHPERNNSWQKHDVELIKKFFSL